MTALVAGAADPVRLGRLQLPLQQQRLLQTLPGLLQWLEAEVRPVASSWTAAEWSDALEQRGAHQRWPMLSQGNPGDGGVWQPLLRWWGRWRHVQAPVTARELLAQGWSAGPALGDELRRLRRQRLADLR